MIQRSNLVTFTCLHFSSRRSPVGLPWTLILKRVILSIILHTGQGHWMTVTTIGTKHPEVLVFDSLCACALTLAKAQIASLLATQHPVITLKFVDLQMQSGTYDCGLFAIAHATALEIICTISLRWENTSTNHFRRRQWHSFRWRKKDRTKSGRWRQRKKLLSIAIVVCQSFQIHVGSNAATARIGFISNHASVCPLRHFSQRTTGLVIAVRELTVFLYAVLLGLSNITFKWLSLANNWVGPRDWEQAAVPFRVLIWDSCPGMFRPVPGFSNAPHTDK